MDFFHAMTLSYYSPALLTQQHTVQLRVQRSPN